MKNEIFFILIITGFFSITYSISFNELELKIIENEKVNIKNSKSKGSRIKANTNTCSITEEKNKINTKFDNSECDIITEGPICLFNGDSVLLPYASVKGLLGYWNFDDIRPMDNSGNRNHGVGVVKPGPAFGSFGASAFFNAGDYFTILDNPAFQSENFTITFWLFMVQDFFSSNNGIRYCPIFQRGKDDLLTKNYKRSPALYFDRKEKNIILYVKTNNNDVIEGESLISNAKVTNQRWLHIGVMKMENKLKIYVNGILDSQTLLKSELEIVAGPLYIGNVPWLKGQCEYPFYIDELRYYNIALQEESIQAEASPVLGGVDPNFLQLGCLDCFLKDASQSCVEGYHICTNIELHTGGYQIARSIGWLNWNTHIWTYSALKTPADFDSLKGLALCCAELK